MRDEPCPDDSTGAPEEHVGTCADCQKALHGLIGSAPDVLDMLPEADTRLSDDAPPELPGYEPVGRIDAGGMGVVWRVRDLEFQRTLAAKVMKAHTCDNPYLRRRFLAEARITGRLAHPSIVPVHAQGQLPDGRPYFTMKLVEGETLAARLKREPAPGAARAELVRVFAQVCQAVAYAHAQGIIHRDLKPANVMVGAFGEVQVMDWGLARVLRDEGGGMKDEEKTEELAASGSSLIPHPSSLRTEAGAVMGTLPYMPPEQARGEVALLDARCDVFNLGAILCEILTGEPPHRVESRDEVLRRVANGELADCFARLDACGADAELVRIAKACLAPTREKRLRDAGTVVAAVTDYEASAEKRLRQVEVQRAEAQVRAREERKRRRLATGLAVVVLTGLVGLAAGAVLLVQKNRQLLATNGALDSARTEAVEKGERAARAGDRALAALDATTSSMTGESLATQIAVTTQQKQFLAGVLPHYLELTREQGADEGTRKRIAGAAYRVGLIQYRLGFHEASARALKQACDDYQKLDADFPADSAYRRGLATSHDNLGVVLRELGQSTRAESAFREALGLREQLAAESPTARHRRDLAGSLNNLGLLLNEFGKRPDDAKRAYQRALTIRKELADEFPAVAYYRQDLAAGHNTLGALFLELGQLDEAEENHQRALDLRQKLADVRGDRPECRRELASSFYSVGDTFRRRGKWADAVKSYRQALTIRQKLADEFPGVPAYRHELASVHSNLGDLLSGTDRSGAAEAHYRDALATWQKLTDEFPGVPEYRKRLTELSALKK